MLRWQDNLIKRADYVMHSGIYDKYSIVREVSNQLGIDSDIVYSELTKSGYDFDKYNDIYYSFDEFLEDPLPDHIKLMKLDADMNFSITSNIAVTVGSSLVLGLLGTLATKGIPLAKSKAALARASYYSKNKDQLAYNTLIELEKKNGIKLSDAEKIAIIKNSTQGNVNFSSTSIIPGIIGGLALGGVIAVILGRIIANKYNSMENKKAISDAINASVSQLGNKVNLTDADVAKLLEIFSIELNKRGVQITPSMKSQLLEVALQVKDDASEGYHTYI